MIINHNLSALLTCNTLKRNDKTSQGVLQKLSSASRINQAADDAAGLAISEKMRSQIRGLEQAGRNVQDGISLVQTAEGALAQSHKFLQRMRELATKAASDSLTSSDRLEIQKEIEHCKTQLDDIALNTEFNNKKLLDGTASVLAGTSDSRVRLNVEGSLLSRDQFGDINTAEGNYHLDIKSTPGTGQVQGSNIFSVKNDNVSEIASMNGGHSGINDFKSRGLIEGSYRISTRETPFGDITYLNEGGAETSNPVTDLGVDAVSASPIPDIMPYGEYDIDVADEVPFMAKFSNSADSSEPDLITGVNPTGRNDIDVAMDITSELTACNAQSKELWNDLSSSGSASITTKDDYDINMYTHFRVLDTETRNLLTSKVEAVTYYRSEAGSKVDLNLSYRAQAGEQVVGHTSYITETGTQITLTVHAEPPQTVDVAVGGMSVDEAAAALENAINALDGGNYAGADFEVVDLGTGQHRIEINNKSGFTLDIVDNSGNTAAELGIASPVGGLANDDIITGTARDMDRQITFDVGGQNLTEIAATMDTNLAAYNIDVAAVDAGSGLSRLQFTNNGVPRHVFTIDNDTASSLESELNIGGITLNPGEVNANSRKVYNNHTLTVDVGDRHSDEIVNQLNTAIQEALALDDLDANNGLTPFANHDNGSGTCSIWVDNSNTLYDITITDNIHTTASEFGLDTHLIARGDSDHSGTEVDFNRALGSIDQGSNIEECLTTVQGWGFPLSCDWSNEADTPGYDGCHHYGKFSISSTEVGRREVVFKDNIGKDQLFGTGGDISLTAGKSIDTQSWLARDRVRVRTSYTGIGNDGTHHALQSRVDWWWEGDDGSTNPLCGDTRLPFDSISIPDSDDNKTELSGSWCIFTSAHAGAGHDKVDIETIDGASGGTFVSTGGLHFSDGVLDNNAAILMPQMIRTGTGSFTVVNHDIDFGSISTQADAVIYSERYGAAGFNHYAHAAYGDDTTYFFAHGGNPEDYLQSVKVWPQEDDNVSMLFTVLNLHPPTVQVEGKGYNRSGTANDFGPLVVNLTDGPISIGCVQFDDLKIGGNLSINDKFVINVAAHAGGGYHGNPPVHSDANIAVSGNPWTIGGATMEYRFDEGVENGKDLNLLGYFVHPLNGGDNSTGIWTGSLALQGIDANGFAAGTKVGNSNIHMEINFNGTTDHRASALVTGYYFRDMEQGEALTDFLSDIEYDVDENQNGSVMFEVLENNEGQLVLRGQAHIYDKNANYRYEYDDYIVLSQNNENITLFNDSGDDGLSFRQFNFADTSRFSPGDRFSLFLSANGEPADSDVDEFYLFSSADRRDIYPHNWRFNDGVLDNSTRELRTYQVNYNNGDVHEGVMEFSFADFHGGGTAQGKNNSQTSRAVDDTVVFQSVQRQGIDTAPAHHYTKLKDIAQFWTPDGRFLLEPPQEIILQNGDQKAYVMLYGKDEIVDVLDRINQAIYTDLGQEDLVDADERFKFVSFIDSYSPNSDLEKIDGSLVIRTAIAGSKGEISLSAPEPLLNALGISILRYAGENEVEVEVRDAKSGKLVNIFTADSNSNIQGAIPGNIGLKIDSDLGVSVDYSEGQEDFNWQGEDNIQLSVQLVNNATILQTGANKGQRQWIELMDASSRALGVDTVSLITRAHANKSIGQLDAAINKISSQRSVLGALQNRLDHSFNNLSLANENLTASESRIRDTDMCKTMTALVKQDIINQAATAMLAQANQNPQTVLKLLGN